MWLPHPSVLGDFLFSFMLLAFLKCLVILGHSYLSVKHKQLGDSGCFNGAFDGGRLCRGTALPSRCFFGEFSVTGTWRPFFVGRSVNGQDALASLAA